MKLRQFNQPDKTVVGFQCPGCGFGHSINVTDPSTWNESMSNPTFEGLMDWSNSAGVCQGTITASVVSFTSKCWHTLAGKTATLADVSNISSNLGGA